MSMAIDRTRISEELYGFAVKPVCNLVTAPPRYASTANDVCLAQDIEGARTLLDDKGVLDTDGDGVREYNGAPLRITYQTTVNAIRQATQVLIRDWWREIGIETELVQHDASVFFGGDPVVDKGRLTAGSSPTSRCTRPAPVSTPSSIWRAGAASISRHERTDGPTGTTPEPATRPMTRP